MPRIVQFYEPGTPNVLRVEDRPVRKPLAGEVLLAVDAIGLNRAEIAFRQGRYLEIPEKFPAGLGLEAAGTILEAGPGVCGFEVGERVATLPVFSMREYGVYGDVAVVPADALIRYPSRLTAAEAASVWMSGLTAYGGLIYLGKLSEGNFVLITAASSSAGIAAIQIARWTGAKVIAITRTGSKKQRLMETGAHFVIVVGEEDVAGRVMEITSGAGADVLFDAVGGGMVGKLANAAALGAQLILYGTLSTELTVLPLLTALRKCLTVHAYRIFSMRRFPAEREKAERFIFDRLSDGSIRAVVDRTFPLERVADAHRYLESNQHFGKVVLCTRATDVEVK
jgi:NADPH:quinone reductase